MSVYSLTHVSDHDLLRHLACLVAQDRNTTAELLAHIAEVDARRLYLPAGFPSMFLYGVHQLHLSEESAFKRIRAARTARQFPAIFDALAEGRLHLSAVLMLTPHLTPENADELLAAAVHKTRAEVEQVLAQWFHAPTCPPGCRASHPRPCPPSRRVAPGRSINTPRGVLTPSEPRSRRSHPSASLQVTLEQTTHDKVAIPAGLAQSPGPLGGAGAGARPRLRRGHPRARAGQVRRHR